ncbi:hypothetical protein JHK82_038585 [Glycine max]|nr:hypothetical protein JHK86_038766 [Glycine max]KAG5109362.1 hypothetical protein JHK82_038585 [Glycine max]
MEVSLLEEVENILRYRFRNKKLLEEALTHSSFLDGVSYERLEFVGDPVLSLAISNYLFLAYPDLDPGQLSALRAANVSTEKLARVAVRIGLHRFVRHSAPPLVDKVERFVDAVKLEIHPVAHGGSVKAPKVLADVVESVAAAIYVDVNFDLQTLWVIMRGVLEPIVTPDALEKQPQPVTMLYEMCQKKGKQVDIKPSREGDLSVAKVFVDGEFVASASSSQKDHAKLEAAKIALGKLAHLVPSTDKKSATNMKLNFAADENGTWVVEAPKNKLRELCAVKKWPIPEYIIEKDSGPSHEKKFVCAVQIPTADGILQMSGDEKSRVKDAENSAASLMIRALQQYNYL